MATIKLCFFGSLSETLSTKEETLELDLPANLTDLKSSLIARGERWQALAEASILCAINHEMVNDNPAINADDEVAFFPPVTGG